jgi:hypothetical protein
VDPPVLTADASIGTQVYWAGKTDYPELEKIGESPWKFHTANPNGYND